MTIDQVLEQQALWEELMANVGLWRKYQAGTLPLPIPDILFALQANIRRIQLQLNRDLE